MEVPQPQIVDVIREVPALGCSIVLHTLHLFPPVCFLFPSLTFFNFILHVGFES